MTKIIPVILCGGSGTRLWPRSRAAKPKPFLPLVGETTLFQQSILRCVDAAHFDAPLIVTGAAHLPHVVDQAGCGPHAPQIIVEPSARNTAAAIALAALRVPADAVLLICPSDHHIADEPAFVAASAQAANLAQQGWLVAFGIHADRPETGYGYIKEGEPIDGGRRIARFVEKPDEATAQAFLDEGGYAWNGGIFCFRADRYLEELERHRPDIAAHSRRAVDGGVSDGAHFHPAADAFAQIESESIDYAVMEHTDLAAVVPADMGWSDIGNWAALKDARNPDDAGNVVSGTAELVDCRNVMVDSDGPRVSVIGLENVVVVVDGNDVMVTSIAGTGKVGKLAGVTNP